MKSQEYNKKSTDKRILLQLLSFILICIFAIALTNANMIYVDQDHREYGRWAMNVLNDNDAFSSVRWSYTTSTLQTKRQGDLTITFQPISDFGLGWNGNIIINSLTDGYPPNQEFLLLHESYHAITNQGHSNDGSIMDMDGGNGQFNEQELNILRGNLQHE